MKKTLTLGVIFSLLVIINSSQASLFVEHDIEFTDANRPNCFARIYFDIDRGAILETRSVYGKDEVEYRKVCEQVIFQMRAKGYELLGGPIYEKVMCTAQALGACKE